MSDLNSDYKNKYTNASQQSKTSKNYKKVTYSVSEKSNGVDSDQDFALNNFYWDSQPESYLQSELGPMEENEYRVSPTKV